MYIVSVTTGHPFTQRQFAEAAEVNVSTVIPEGNGEGGLLSFFFDGGSQSGGYVKTQKGKRKVHTGKRGGKYIMMGGKKKYLK